MNARDLENAMNYWVNHTDYIDDMSMQSYELWERVHEINASGKSTMTVATLEEVACAVAYHARTFAGTWDATMLAEIAEAFRYRVQVIYPNKPLPRIERPEERARMVSI